MKAYGWEGGRRLTGLKTYLGKALKSFCREIRREVSAHKTEIGRLEDEAI